MAFGAILGQRPGVQSVNNVLPDVQGNVALNAKNVGAAPAGYGLGGDATLVPSGASLDTYTSTGFYRWGVGTKQVPFEAGTMIVVKRSEQYIHQLAFRSDVQRVEIAVRAMVEGVFDEWEWLDPPMVAGVVYRTTRKYMGKPVYTKLIDCGTLPYNTRKNVSYGVTDPGGVGTGAPIVVIEVVAGTNEGVCFPRFEGAGNMPRFTISTYASEMQIITTGMSGASSSKVYAQIWYTRQSM